MRLIRFSLAAKYRILFGTAVLLIIAAALSVPWQVIQRLVVQQPFREAESLANAYFLRELHGSADGQPTLLTNEYSLLPERGTAEPRFISIVPDVTDPRSLANPDNQSEFMAAIFAKFRRPNVEYTYRVSSTGEGDLFRYALAVRVHRSCLSCHGEGKVATAYRENELAGAITVDIPIQYSEAQLFYYRWWMIAAGALAGTLAILVFYLITHRFILAPINELNSVALRVTAGDLDERSALQTGDEFETLSDNLNTMLERLRASQLELRNANRLLDEKLGEMAETNVALHEANRLKNEFLANVSHELRTPLTSIIGFAELLREGPQFNHDAKIARYLENILISARILLEIINDLLDLAKIEAGRVELQIEPVDAVDLCATLLDFVRPLSDKKQLDLRLETDPECPALQTDRGRLRQILYNLLSNAVKFTPAGGRVTMRVHARGAGRVELAVADTGPGIQPDQQKLIFEKFRQLDQSATKEHPGTGLGLAIAKELTMLLGGEIGLESRPGQGATFWIQLPLRSPTVATPTPIAL